MCAIGKVQPGVFVTISATFRFSPLLRRFGSRAFVLGMALDVLSCSSGAHAESSKEGGRMKALPTKAIEDAQRLGEAFSSVAEFVSPAVVSIRIEAKRTQSPFPFRFFGPNPFGGEDEGDGITRGNGSGVIIRSDGYILTNRHVVEKATRIEVRLQDDRRFQAKVVGMDAATDLAVLKIGAQKLRAASFADSSRIRVGEWVVAIGSPFGLDYTVTAGVVSAIGRGGIGANEIEDYLQTDASINPGNSGGPLVNLRGEVVGINTMIVGRGTGIGFAVPSSLAKHVTEQIILSGKVRRAWIGVGFQELTPELAKQFGVPNARGALVGSVMNNGPAARAGLRAGDVVVSVDGQGVKEGRDLLRTIISKKIGQSVKLEVLRNKERKTFTLTTEQRPDQGGAAAGSRQGRAPAAPASDEFGLQLQGITPQLAQELGVKEAGVLIARVTPGSPAERVGLRARDVILEADRKPARSESEVQRALSDGTALLRIQRGEGSLFVVLSKDEGQP